MEILRRSMTEDECKCDSSDDPKCADKLSDELNIRERIKISKFLFGLKTFQSNLEIRAFLKIEKRACNIHWLK